MNKCVLSMILAGYAFTPEEKQEIIDELMKFREDEIIFRSKSYVDRRARFYADRESGDAYAIIGVLDVDAGNEFQRKFVKRCYNKRKFFSFEKSLQQDAKKNDAVALYDVVLAARFHNIEPVRSEDEILSDIIEYYDPNTGGFYYLDKRERKRGLLMDGVPKLNALFSAVSALHCLKYKYQS